MTEGFTEESVPQPDSRIIKIITDEPSENIKILDFDKYSIKLAKIIRDSFPRFTVGIYGGWGTGKTTLMQHLRSQLEKNDKIVTVWFDAWRMKKRIIQQSYLFSERSN